jgi:HPt (histidine-containing phosphotransfer) domain-containing protein
VNVDRLFEIYPDDATRVRGLVERYLHQSAGLLEELEGAVASCDAEKIRRLAHKWAGSSGGCGVVALVPVLQRMEGAARAGSLASAAADLDETRQCWARVHGFLTDFARRLAADAS